jgi:hypothetical protein
LTIKLTQRLPCSHPLARARGFDSERSLE